MREFIRRFWKRLMNHQFTFEQLVQRDFKQKYTRTVLGMLWSILNPVLSLLVMRLVFTQFFGRTTSHYTTYMFAGNVIFNFYREVTSGDMLALVNNAGIITKVPVPKYLFVLSKSVSAIINFGLTLIVFFLFAALDGVAITWKFFLLIYPVLTMIVFSVGVGMTLSALYVFFRDLGYLYDIFTMLLMYLSAIFYQVDTFSLKIQKLFLLNPVYAHIRYFRRIVLDGVIPSVQYHLLLLLYSVFFIVIGALVYKSQSKRFLYFL